MVPAAALGGVMLASAVIDRRSSLRARGCGAGVAGPDLAGGGRQAAPGWYHRFGPIPGRARIETPARAGWLTALRAFPWSANVTYERTHHDYPAADIIAACGSRSSPLRTAWCSRSTGPTRTTRPPTTGPLAVGSSCRCSAMTGCATTAPTSASITAGRRRRRPGARRRPAGLGRRHRPHQRVSPALRHLAAVRPRPATGGSAGV